MMSIILKMVALVVVKITRLMKHTHSAKRKFQAKISRHGNSMSSIKTTATKIYHQKDYTFVQISTELYSQYSLTTIKV